MGAPGKVERLGELEVYLMILDWTNTKPTKPGMYLRNNPAASAIVRAWIVSIDGVLNIIGKDGGGLSRLNNVSSTFWWLGPIEDPPYFDQIENHV